MRSSLDALLRELTELRHMVESIQPVNLVLSTHQDPFISRYLAIRRRFDYTASIVSLYASFERFAEDTAKAFVRIVAEKQVYSDFSENFRKTHRTKTAEYLQKSKIGEGRYVDISEEELIRNLYHCITGAQEYNLNLAPLISHEQNLRLPILNSLFSNIGIDCVSANTDPILECYCRIEQIETPPATGTPSSFIEKNLGKLVHNRNQIAHGGNPDQLLGSDDLMELIDFIENLSKSIFVRTAAEYLQKCQIAKHHSTELVLQESLKRDGHVIIARKPKSRLFIKQPIFITSDGFGLRWGRIQSLMLDGANISEFPENTSAPNGVGISVDFRCTKNAKIYVLNLDDEYIWPQEPESIAP